MSQKNIIQFILDRKVKVIDFSVEKKMNPSTTILNYLRSLPTHKGVKEGCAEGDCGACTIVIAEPALNGKLLYKAFDSCLLFLPMIHGKQLITVENLAQHDKGEVILHPVQQLMVDMNGSQCGYCTPGIVMSLFSLYKNCNHPSRREAEDALTGNLCRCTGYQPILDAALAACTKNGEDHFTEKEELINAELLKIIKEQPSVVIETDSQKYFRSATLKKAIAIKLKYPDIVVLNGATDIALRQTKKHEHLPALLDLSGIEELKFFRKKKDGYYIGSGLSIESIRLKSEGKIPALHEMLNVFASGQIRNLATLGGNVGSASPIGDTLPVLFACNASVILAGKNGQRKLPITDFIRGYRSTDLLPDEFIHSVIIPHMAKDVIIKSYKVSKRKDLDISTVSAGFMLKLSKDKIVEEVILAYGGMADRTKRATNMENALKGKIWSREVVESAMLLVDKDFSPISDARAGKEFRLIAARNLLMKFYSETKN
jgi:xanthine dehydrogenase small subunit